MSLPISADVRMKEIKRRYLYKNTVVLTLSIRYPVIWLPVSRNAQNRINRTLQSQICYYQRYVSTSLYKGAMKEYQDAQKNGFPFRPYDAVMQYEISYNYNCYFSTYHDIYEFTGGAHGNTIRTSDTWNLKTGRRLPLSAYFPPGTDYQKLFLEQILIQADKEHSNYFENYRELIVQNFNPKNYYLSEDGFNLYYQQYEIAPYSTGIVVFTVFYGIVGWFPQCSQFN